MAITTAAVTIQTLPRRYLLSNFFFIFVVTVFWSAHLVADLRSSITEHMATIMDRQSQSLNGLDQSKGIDDTDDGTVKSRITAPV